MSTLLRDPYIETKPKKVYYSGRWRNTAPEYSFADAAREISVITKLIKAGTPLDGNYYRQNMHNKPDLLLAAEGIMHLHPLGAGTSELIFLMQYDDYVLLLECSDHDQFRIDPPGTALRLLHDESILNVRVRHERREAQEREVRAGLFGELYQNDN